jgi:hypothetical protein
MASLIDKILSFDEPFGNTAARKQDLQQTTESLKDQLNEKLADLKIDGARLGKQALVIGGSIAAVYVLLQMLLPDEEPDYRQQFSNNGGQQPLIVAQRHSESSWVSKAVQSFVITTVLGIARQKLMEFLESQNQTDAGQDTTNTSTK